MFMNKQSYDALSDAQKAVLTQAGTELADKYAQIVIGANSKALKAMREDAYDRPVKVLEVSAEERAALNAATEPFLNDWKENAASVGLNPDKMIEVYTQAVAEYTAEFEAKGYPWERN
ncbi:MAG: TRAP-type C4-dicarboxylate transport system substrate-binding protein [Pseudophaeobacter arcticus]|jgi:TRAP-type C4-dicarboxylate transport system substrate-binding protein